MNMYLFKFGEQELHIIAKDQTDAFDAAWRELPKCQRDDYDLEYIEDYPVDRDGSRNY